MSQATDDFLNKWNQKCQYEIQLDHLLAPTREAIQEFFNIHNSIAWTDLIVHKSFTNEYIVDLHALYYSYGDEENETYSIPLEACIAGKAEVLAYLEQEKRKEAEISLRMGQARDARERDQRYQDYLDLKYEFDPPPASMVKT